MKSIVSVIIPAYNAEPYIERSVKSVINQTYRNLEIIVVDDGSTDKTAEIVKSYNDPRIIYLYQENQGQGPARNYGIGKSTGQYVTLLDADDVYLPEKVEKQVQFLQVHSQYKVVYCNALHFYSRNPNRILKKKCVYPSGDIFPDLLLTSLINPNTIMFHRQVLEKVGCFNEKRYYPEDWDMWLRISRAGFEFGYLDEDLVKVEIREDSNTTMEIQGTLKKNALEMLENIFSQMTEREKDFYDADTVLRKMKFKLAIAYLINGRKKDFFNIFTGLCRYPLKIVAFFLAGVLLVLPSPLLRTCLVRLWKKEQLGRFYLSSGKDVDF